VLLQQVFMNLISNALKHGTADAPRIEIGAEPVPDGWELYVRDSGPGVPARARMDRLRRRTGRDVSLYMAKRPASCA
jgi:signal transduction histidine kinase